MRDVYQSVLVNSDIYESTEVYDVTYSSLQNHTRLQILHIQDITAKDWLRHILTRIPARLL